MPADRCNLVIFKHDRHLVLLLVATKGTVLGALVETEIVIPAITIKNILQQRRAECVAYIKPTHAGFDFGKLFLGDEVSLLDIDAMHAKSSATLDQHGHNASGNADSKMGKAHSGLSKRISYTL